LHADHSVLDVPVERDAKSPGASEQSPEPLVEREHDDVLAPGSGGGGVLRGNRRLPGPGWPQNERGRAAVEPASQKVIDLRNPRGTRPAENPRGVLGGDQTREHDDSPVLVFKIVIPASKLHST